MADVLMRRSLQSWGVSGLTASAPSLGRGLARLLWALALACLCWLALPAGAESLVAVPALTARVTDLTGTLTPEQRNALETQLAQYEQQRGSQIFVLMVPTTAPETIDQYSIRVADAWKAGRKGVDDGVIMLIAKDNPNDLRKMRIEVGRGVQGSLTDAISGRILRDVMAPYFRNGDFSAVWPPVSQRWKRRSTTKRCRHRNCRPRVRRTPIFPTFCRCCSSSSSSRWW